MEVHHHPNLHHDKKPWKEYILEGLMIFFAVMMGFIAENIREHISEHKRAAEFAQSYYEDIKKDSAALAAAMRFSKYKIAVTDSVITMLHAPRQMQNDTVIYKQSAISSNVMAFEPSDGTYEQIKSSGSLRFFDQKLVSLMNSYNVQVKKTVKREDIDLKFIVEQLIPLAVRNSNSEVVFDIYFKHHISHELYFDAANKSYVRELINHIVITKIQRMRAMAEYTKQMKISAEVLKELRKEYDLWDE
jgi:hypothetical protein